MKGPGILWMLQTAAGMSMAGPMFYLGGNYLLAGRYLEGVGFLLLGALVLYFPTYLVNRIRGRVSRIGGPRTWIRRRLGGDDGEEGGPDADADPDTDAPTDGDGADPFDRLRRR